jgi:hypothetical protein
MRTVPALLRVVSLVFSLFRDAIRFVLLWTRSCVSLRAENLSLRKQLALYLERKTKPRRANDATRLTLALLSKLFAWKEALVIVNPETLIKWHRKGFRLFWGWKSKRRGRPRIAINLRNLIVEMARSNLTWGEERIAAERFGMCDFPRRSSVGFGARQRNLLPLLETKRTRVLTQRLPQSIFA